MSRLLDLPHTHCSPIIFRVPVVPLSFCCSTVHGPKSQAACFKLPFSMGLRRGVLYSSIMVYNNLRQNIEMMSDNVKIFKRTLKSFLITNAFYSIDEYISAKHA
jgi:hypothetical protein